MSENCVHQDFHQGLLLNWTGIGKFQSWLSLIFVLGQAPLNEAGQSSSSKYEVNFVWCGLWESYFESEFKCFPWVNWSTIHEARSNIICDGWYRFRLLCCHSLIPVDANNLLTFRKGNFEYFGHGKIILIFEAEFCWKYDEHGYYSHSCSVHGVDSIEYFSLQVVIIKHLIWPTHGYWQKEATCLA